MNRLHICFVLLFGMLISLACNRPLCAAGARPNIVIMLADDMGFSDLGCYGSEIATPNLDRLASNGVRFTQFYNTARCCPTRAALLTGLYQHQAGVGHMTGDYGKPSYRGFLNDECVTIGEVLQASGYQTLCIGKWHVGSKRGQWPLDRGFDRYFGCPLGGGFYFPKSMASKNRFLTLGNEIADFPDEAYVTDLFNDYALKFVDEAATSDRPFFMYFAHIAPHWPLQAKPKDIQKYAGRYSVGWDRIRAQRYQRQLELGIVQANWGKSERDPKAVAWNQLNDSKREDLAHRMSVYAAQIDSIDQNVGRLLGRLESHDCLDNTVFVFLSDNGCSAEGGPGGFRRANQAAEIGTDESYASAGLEWANVSDTPFRKFKTQTHEGGISSPFIVHWPNGLDETGRIEHQLGHVIDLMPTCVGLTGAEYPTERNGIPVKPMEGTSLVNAFRGQSIERKPLFWEHQGNRAVRDGSWKLVAAHKGDWELYDMSTDRAETNNLASEQPAVVAQLAKAWDTWADRCNVLPWPVK